MHACRGQLDTRLGLDPLTSVGPTPRALLEALNSTTLKTTTTPSRSRSIATMGRQEVLLTPTRIVVNQHSAQWTTNGECIQISRKR